MPGFGPTYTCGRVTVRAVTSSTVHRETLESLARELPPGALPAYCRKCKSGSGVYIKSADTGDGPSRLSSIVERARRDGQQAKCQWCKVEKSEGDHPSQWYLCNNVSCVALTCSSCVQKWGWGRNLATKGERFTLMLQNVDAGLRLLDDYPNLNRAEVLDDLVKCTAHCLQCRECTYKAMGDRSKDLYFVSFFNTEPTGDREHRGLRVGTKCVALLVSVDGGPEFDFNLCIYSKCGNPVQPNGNPSAGSPQAVRSTYPDSGWWCPYFSGQCYAPSLHHAGFCPYPSGPQYAPSLHHAASPPMLPAFDAVSQAGEHQASQRRPVSFRGVVDWAPPARVSANGEHLEADDYEPPGVAMTEEQLDAHLRRLGLA